MGTSRKGDGWYVLNGELPRRISEGRGSPVEREYMFVGLALGAADCLYEGGRVSLKTGVWKRGRLNADGF